jgi:hypothetical protein
MGLPARRLINRIFLNMAIWPAWIPFLSMFETKRFFPQSMPASSLSIRMLTDGVPQGIPEKKILV